MEALAACGLWGAMFRLPGMLDGLPQRHGSILPKGVEDEIPLIKRDLEEILAILKGHSDSELEEGRSTMVVRCWTKEVRELSYDLEDFIDEYDHTTARSRGGPIPRRKVTRRRRRSRTTLPWLHENLRQRLWIANKMREFSARAQEALQRYGMCNLGAIAANASGTKCAGASTSSWNSALCRDDGDLVGIGAAMDELEEWLMTMHGEEHQKLRVVSGSGGVGKTTFANELYRKFGQQFECRAFVRTCRKPDMRRLFISMLAQVRPHQPPDNWEVHSLISSIRAHLQDKRYLIVIDDLWATSTWDIIKCALPDGNSCSRILTTTEIEDIALQSCDYDSKYVFKMKPLGMDDSRKLFFSSLFGPQLECPSELREVSDDIIRKCGGLPLAILTIASILASHQLGIHDKWDHVNKSLGYSLITNPTWEGMKQVLNLSYNSLPQHLKACMLYMSIYQEDNIISKDDLVNQWIAEGFIWATEEQDKQEISGAYFDELVLRKMIRPVDTNNNGEVLSCVVHPMVLNLIAAYKSIEENFVTAIHHSQTTTVLADKVRRLSLHFGNAQNAMPPTNMRLSQVRTLAYFGVFKCMPSIVEFRLLRVLILHLWGDKDSIRLNTIISGLFRLRYLKVTSNVTLELQTQMRGLRYLETIEIDARASAIPSDITHLPGLLHLSLPAETDMPNDIGDMTSLRRLGYFDLSGNSMETVQSLGRLTNLRDLQLTCSNIHSDNLNSKMQFLVGSIIGRLSNLKSLTLVSTASSNADSQDDASATGMSVSGDGFSSASSPLNLLQRLEFSPRICMFSCLPKCIEQLSNLCSLKIGVRKIVRNDVDALKGLPALAVLSLYVHTKPAERIVIGKAGFSVLKYLKFKCSDPCLQFDADAMPNLRKLKLCFNARKDDQQSTIPVGIEHLSGLKEVSAVIGGAGAEESNTRAAEMAFWDAIKVLARRPTVTVKCVSQIYGCEEDHTNVTREDEHRSLKQRLEEVSDAHDEIMEDAGREAVKHAYSRFTLPEWHILLLLRNKLDNQHDDITRAIPVVDPYSVDPWKLAEIGTGAGFYFRPTQAEEASDGRPNQAPSGYWKATGFAGSIYSAERISIGMKRTMEFYRGCAPSGIKTKWKMKEFTAFQKAATGGLTPRSEMTLCQLYMEPTTFSAGNLELGIPARLLEEEEHGDLIKQHGIRMEEPEPSEKDEISSNVSGQNVNKQAGITFAKQPSISKKVRTSSPSDDGYSWRKYGQKDFLGAKHPRSYYRCTSRVYHGCPATKTMQRTDDDPLLFDVVYRGQHTCAARPRNKVYAEAPGRLTLD